MQAIRRSVVHPKTRKIRPGIMHNERHVLLVEDDDAMALALARALMMEGLRVTVARSGEEALAMLGSAPYEMLIDMMVLDIGLPGIDGFEVLSRLRTSGQTLPVMVLTASGDDKIRAKSFKLGADVFLGKPIATGEFAAQVRALTRRAGGANQIRLVYGPLILDREAGRAFLNGNAIELPRREWSLLEILLTRTGRILSKETIGRNIAGNGEELSTTAIEVHMSRLRTKLVPAGIHVLSVRGLGYMLPKWDPHARDC